MPKKLPNNSSAETPQIPHENGREKIMSIVRSFLLMTLLAGCPARYKGCVDWNSFDVSDTTTKAEAVAAKERDVKKYLGKWKIEKGSEFVNIGISESKGKKGKQQSLTLKNGDMVQLVKPVKIDGNYHIKYLVVMSKDDKFSSSGGIYKLDDNDIIAFTVTSKKSQMNIVMVVKQEDGKIMASVPEKYNDKKISGHFDGWFELKQ